jgi:plastocyanin
MQIVPVNRPSTLQPTHTMRSSLRSLIVVGSLATGLLACGSSSTAPRTPTPSPAAGTVNAVPSLAFTPSTITIAPGGTVTFAFGSVGHNVFFDATPGAPADIPGVNADTSVVRSFASTGTFTFHCHIHAGMTGTVVVAATTSSNTTGGTNNGGGYGNP